MSYRLAGLFFSLGICVIRPPSNNKVHSKMQTVKYVPGLPSIVSSQIRELKKRWYIYYTTVSACVVINFNCKAVALSQPLCL